MKKNLLELIALLESTTTASVISAPASKLRQEAITSHGRIESVIATILDAQQSVVDASRAYVSWVGIITKDPAEGIALEQAVVDALAILDALKGEETA